MDSVRILGIEVSCTDVPGMFDRVREWSRQETERTILYVNAHCFNVAAGDAVYQRILNNADLVFSDGISVVWASRLLGGCTLRKMTCADWIYDFAAFAENALAEVPGGLRVYILAGKPGVAERACRNLCERFPGLNIVGTGDGYFAGKSEAQVLQEIARTAPHVVFVGMGTPLQEKWISAHRDAISAPVCLSVGALFDYVAGVEARVPPWMNALGLEWFWRLLVDPLGKWRRYLVGNPLFVYRVLRQKFNLSRP